MSNPNHPVSLYSIGPGLYAGSSPYGPIVVGAIELGQPNYFATEITRRWNGYNDLVTTLEELCDLVDSIRTGEYTPDSFTTQLDLSYRDRLELWRPR